MAHSGVNRVGPSENAFQDVDPSASAGDFGSREVKEVSFGRAVLNGAKTVAFETVVSIPFVVYFVAIQVIGGVLATLSLIPGAGHATRPLEAGRLKLFSGVAGAYVAANRLAYGKGSDELFGARSKYVASVANVSAWILRNADELQRVKAATIALQAMSFQVGEVKKEDASHGLVKSALVENYQILKKDDPTFNSKSQAAINVFARLLESIMTAPDKAEVSVSAKGNVWRISDSKPVSDPEGFFGAVQRRFRR